MNETYQASVNQGVLSENGEQEMPKITQKLVEKVTEKVYTMFLLELRLDYERARRSGLFVNRSGVK